MKKYTNALLSIATVIGLSTSTSVFADSIYGVLENNQVSDIAVDIKEIAESSEPNTNGSRGGSPSKQYSNGYSGRR